jgi:hypothetical protein
MTSNKPKFSIIELLTITAIVTVWGVAFEPTIGTTVRQKWATIATANVGKVAQAMALYQADWDNHRTPLLLHDLDSVGNTIEERSWKQLIQKYTTTNNIQRDAANPAAEFWDAHSDPAYHYFRFPNGRILTPEMQFHRSYGYTWAWNLGGPFDPGANNGASPSMSAFRDMTKTLGTWETKQFLEDANPNVTWDKSVDGLTNWLGHGVAPTTGLEWTWGGNKWLNKAQVASFLDTHVARLQNLDLCASTIGEVSYWGTLVGTDDLATPNDPTSARMPSQYAVCSTIPLQFR